LFFRDDAILTDKQEEFFLLNLIFRYNK